MLTDLTVFIIGAGAHVPYGFPTGDGLRAEILKTRLNHIPLDQSNNKRKAESQQFLDEFLKNFADSGDSIDTFLETRPNWKEVGTWCITHEIISYEDLSKINTYMEKYGQGQDWIRWLLTKLRSKTLEDFANNAIAFITFNYDRYLEHRLFVALKAQFGASDEAVRDVIEKIPIFHVHGTIGRLPWQTYRDGDFILPFGSKPDPAKIKEAAKSIKLVHETGLDDGQTTTAREVLTNARNILFLGFGYDKRNLKKLPLPLGSENTWMNGTAYGMTEAERKNMSNQLFRFSTLAEVCPGHTQWDCLTFLRNCACILQQDTLIEWPEEDDGMAIETSEM